MPLFTFIQSSFLLLFFIVSPAFAQSSSEAYRTEIFRNLTQPEVNIRTSGGSIEVIGHNENTIRVEMFVKRGSRYLQPSDTDLSDFDISISQEGKLITASAKKASGGGWNWLSGDRVPSISFKLMVPQNSFVDGRTSGGSVSAANIQNDMDLSTSGGSVRLEGSSGNISLRTSGGSIGITDVSGTLEASTSGGAIRAEQAYGTIALRSSGGSIRIVESGGAISARTSGGSIRAELSELREGLDLRTSGGNITIEIPGPAPYELDLRGNRVNIDLVEFTGDSSRNRITGSMMGGGSMIVARTSGGRVSVNFR